MRLLVVADAASITRGNNSCKLGPGLDTMAFSCAITFEDQPMVGVWVLLHEAQWLLPVEMHAAMRTHAYAHGQHG